MNQPREYHIDGFLSGLVVGYRPGDFIADQILPVVTVGKQSDVYARIDKGDWFRNEVSDRSPGALPNEINYTVSSDNYFAPNFALRHGVPIETVDNADPPHAPLQRGAEYLMDKLMLGYEIRTESTVTAGVGSFSAQTGTNAWSDFTNSDPMGNLEQGGEAIRATTGKNPNTCVIGRKAWNKIRRHPDIVARVFPGAGIGGMVDQAAFANLIGVNKLLIGNTIKNTANQGAADAFSDVWSTHCHLLYVEPSPGIMTATFGLALRWTGPNIGGQGPGNLQIERKFDDDRGVWWLRSGYYQDEKIVSAELGFQIRTGITS